MKKEALKKNCFSSRKLHCNIDNAMQQGLERLKPTSHSSSLGDFFEVDLSRQGFRFKLRFKPCS